jgi:hypothetical protein
MTLERQFEKFTGGPSGKRMSGRFRITINKRGTIYFSDRAYEAIGRPKAVALYYNREDDVIAIEPAYPRFIQNFPVKQAQMGWVVWAASFCRHYRIDIADTDVFNRPEVNNDGILLLNLRDTTRVGGFAKKRARPKTISQNSL